LWRVLRYNGLVCAKFRCATASVILLLRPQANDPKLNGKLTLSAPGTNTSTSLDYHVVRLWEMDVQQILRGGVSTLPLAPLAKVDEADLPDVVREMDERLAREIPPGEHKRLMTASYILAGMRYDKAFAEHLYRGVREMRESTTWQGIYDEGGVKSLHTALLRQGTVKFGEPTSTARSNIQLLTDQAQLISLFERVLTVSTWDELLQPITGSTKPRRRKRS